MEKTDWMRELKPLIMGSGVSSSKEYDTAYNVILECIKGGIRCFDTAPSYGTEKMLGDILHKCCEQLNVDRSELYVQTKIDAWQMQDGNISSFLTQSLDKMHFDYFDALLVHWPVPDYLDETWRQMIELYKVGKVNNIGICNVRMRQLKRFTTWDVKPKIIQIERNPLRTCLDEVQFCHENDIIIQAYSPLCKMDTRIQDNNEIQLIANKYGVNVGQVVMRWHIDNGVIPVFTTSKVSRIKEYLDLNRFSLTDDEISFINNLNEDYKIYLEACACPGF